MALTAEQKRYLRQQAHALKPVVIVGDAGVSEELLAELEHSLEAHELLKVRVNAADREDRQAMVERLCRTTGAELVQRVGHVAVLYRPAAEPRLKLPGAR